MSILLAGQFNTNLQVPETQAIVSALKFNPQHKMSNSNLRAVPPIIFAFNGKEADHMFVV